MAKDIFGHFGRQNWQNGQWPIPAKRPKANPAIVVSTYVTIKTSTYQLTDNQLGSNPIQNFLVILVRLLINYYEIINLISTRFQPGFKPILTEIGRAHV